MFSSWINQKRFGGNNKIAAVSVNLGATKGRGSSTRMFNYCKQHSPAPSLCIDQFITIRSSYVPPSYSITFVKLTGQDYTNPLYQDRITDNVWFTRLNTGGPLFNYKYYVNESIVPTRNILNDDFWYDIPGSQGGTIGVKWAILNSSGFPDVSAPGINPQLFGTIGNTSNFFSFSQMCVLLTAMIDESSKPVSLVDESNSNEWLLEDTNTTDGTEMPYLENKDLGCYIPALNLYFRIKISVWGIGDDGNPGAISYQRTALYNPN